MNPRYLRPVLPAAALTAVVALAGCNSSSGHAASHASAEAHVSALATSSAGQALKSAAKKDAAKCEPSGVTMQAWEYQLATSKAARERLYGCEKIPPQDRQQAGTCAVKAAETALAATGAKPAREAAFVAALNRCVPS